LVRTLSRRLWLRRLLLLLLLWRRSESGGAGRMSPASRAAQAEPVAWMLLAGPRLSAPPVKEWEAWCGGIGFLSCRCTATAGRPGASHPPRGSASRLFPTVPKHPLQSLWHAIEPEFLASGVAPVSQDRRRGAGSNPVSSASLPPPPPAPGSPTVPPSRVSLAAPLCGARLRHEIDWSGLHRHPVQRPPGPNWERAVSQWLVASRDWPPLKATRTSTAPKHRCSLFGMQYSLSFLRRVWRRSAKTGAGGSATLK